MLHLVKKYSVTFLLLISLVSIALAQADLSTPYGTIYTHLKYLQADSYKPSIAGETIYGTMQEEEREDLAVKLKQVLDGKGLYIDIYKLPENPEYTDSATGKHIYTLSSEAPEIYVERINGNWYYSRTTVSQINKLHSAVYPFGSDVFQNLLGENGQQTFLGLKYWQWLTLFLLIAIAVVVFFIVNTVLKFFFKSIAKSTMGKRYLDLELINPVTKAISLILAAVLFQYFLPSLLLPIRLSQFGVMAINIFIVVFVTVLGVRLVNLVISYMSRVAKKTESTMDDQVLPILSKVLKGIVIILGVIYLLSVVGVNIIPLLAGLSIGGLALALAAQDTVKNFLGSVMIFLDKPFQIGDLISFSGAEGTVEEVGVRSTRIRTLENSLAYVPNGELANMTINNLGLRIYRRWKTELGVMYDTPPELIEAFRDGIDKMIAAHPKSRKDNYEVHLSSFEDSSINIMLSMFFDVADWREYLKSRHQLMIGIIKLADSLGVQFAFPTQTIHIENMPGTDSLSPKYKTGKKFIEESLAKQLEDFSNQLEK